MSDNDDLFEWYEGLGPNAMQVSPENQPENESPKKVVDNIEKGAELHKAMAMNRALDNKLALLSGAFTGYEDEAKRKKLRDEATELARRIVKILEDFAKGGSKEDETEE